MSKRFSIETTTVTGPEFFHLSVRVIDNDLNQPVPFFSPSEDGPKAIKRVHINASRTEATFHFTPSVTVADVNVFTSWLRGKINLYRANQDHMVQMQDFVKVELQMLEDKLND